MNLARIVGWLLVIVGIIIYTSTFVNSTVIRRFIPENNAIYGIAPYVNVMRPSIVLFGRDYQLLDYLTALTIAIIGMFLNIMATSPNLRNKLSKFIRSREK